MTRIATYAQGFYVIDTDSREALAGPLHDAADAQNVWLESQRRAVECEVWYRGLHGSWQPLGHTFKPSEAHH